MTLERDKAVGVRFGTNLRRERRHAGLSQEQLGCAADLHRTAIGMLEKGERIPRVDTLVQLSEALNISPLALLDGIKWRMPDRPANGEFIISKD